jgi:hypothetical protein
MRQRTIALALAAMLLGTAGQASAQGRNRDAGWWPWQGGGWETVRQEGNGKKAEKAARARAGRIDDYDDDRRAQGERRGNGPPFCRNGQGHPVHGLEWCRRKGWSEAGWGNVIFHNPLPSNRRLEQPSVRDILGSVILGRLTSYSRQLGATGPIDGRTLTVGNASVLQLRAGGIPLAELTDRNGDGRVDLVLLAGS